MTFETWYNLDDDCRYWYATGDETPEKLYQAVLERYNLLVENTVYTVLDDNMVRVKVIK